MNEMQKVIALAYFFNNKENPTEEVLKIIEKIQQR